MSNVSKVFQIITVISINLTILAAVALGILVYAPFSPLPNAWNPRTALVTTDPITPATRYKLYRIEDDLAACLTHLDDIGATYEKRPDFAVDENCGITGRVLLQSLAKTTLPKMETQCQIALRLALYDQHILQPAADEIFGQGLKRINTQGSYNCRLANTGDPNETRYSLHATARAVDISGFELEDGTEITLTDHWASDDKKAEFLRRTRDGGCKLFTLTLSPDYNIQHADHFHFDTGKNYGCR